LDHAVGQQHLCKLLIPRADSLDALFDINFQDSPSGQNLDSTIASFTLMLQKLTTYVSLLLIHSKTELNTPGHANLYQSPVFCQGNT